MGDFDEMKLARVIAAAGGIDGRVKMQKIVYLLTAMGYELPYQDFTIRQLGPFSRAVAVAADILKGSGFVEEKPLEFGADASGEPVTQYRYQVRDKIAAVARKHFDVPTPAGKLPLDEVAPLLKKYDRATLEVAATRLYLEREDKLSGEALETELRRLKGHLQNVFQPANRLIEDLKRRRLL